MKRIIQLLKWRAYHFWLGLKMISIRKKDRIRFLFILQELSQWKTESLYKAMLDHPRFEPILGITQNPEYPGSEKTVAKYCLEKGYPVVSLDPRKTISEQLEVDMLMHQKPYYIEINPAHRIESNPGIPTVYVPYYLSLITEEWTVNARATLLAWRLFFDNAEDSDSWSKMNKLHGLNYCVTGLPMMDEMLIPQADLVDDWPVKDNRKRIIYAPHHTIGDYHWEGIAYSTFLDYCQFMLEMRDKYKEQVFFVFKPHPHLYSNLVDYWGEEKARSYYAAWADEDSSQVRVNDKYLSLFKYSDAMIHDCSSFTIEYMFTGNPVLYLERDSHHADNMSATAARAYGLHYKAWSEKDIESFIQRVIAGEDPLAGERRQFVNTNLRPPHGKSACENIINAILGKEEYHR